MPQYEYICEEDGEVLTLLRPMADADAPVEDPTGLGRRFVRRLSSFAVADSSKRSTPDIPAGCPCGNPNGPCSMG